MSNIVGERFQITIDKQVREQLGIQPGDRAIEFAEDGRLVVYFMPRPHARSLMGILRRPGMPQGPVDITAEREAAWTARTAEIMEVLAEDSLRHRDQDASDPG